MSPPLHTSDSHPRHLDQDPGMVDSASTGAESMAFAWSPEDVPPGLVYTQDGWTGGNDSRDGTWMSSAPTPPSGEANVSTIANLGAQEQAFVPWLQGSEHMASSRFYEPHLASVPASQPTLFNEPGLFGPIVLGAEAGVEPSPYGTAPLLHPMSCSGRDAAMAVAPGFESDLALPSFDSCSVGQVKPGTQSPSTVPLPQEPFSSVPSLAPSMTPLVHLEQGCEIPSEYHFYAPLSVPTLPAQLTAVDVSSPTHADQFSRTVLSSTAAFAKTCTSNSPATLDIGPAEPERTHVDPKHCVIEADVTIHDGKLEPDRSVRLEPSNDEVPPPQKLKRVREHSADLDCPSPRKRAKGEEDSGSAEPKRPTWGNNHDTSSEEVNFGIRDGLLNLTGRIRTLKLRESTRISGCYYPVLYGEDTYWDLLCQVLYRATPYSEESLPGKATVLANVCLRACLCPDSCFATRNRMMRRALRIACIIDLGHDTSIRRALVEILNLVNEMTLEDDVQAGLDALMARYSAPVV